jgi:hypothetical protein
MFNSEDEWKAYAGQFRPNRGYYNPQPEDMYPQKFPCLMMYTSAIIHRENGNDEFFNFFAYEGDYQEVEN